LLLISLAAAMFLLSFAVFPPFGDAQTARILVLGLDKAEEGAQRSDTILLVNAKLDGSGTTLLSVPRDARARIPDHGTRKINAAYAIGGEALTRRTLAQATVLDADCPFYVILDSDAVRAMVDALGGVTVDVPTRMKYDDHWGDLHIDLQPGHQRLNGTQTVGFLRWRKNNPGIRGPGGDDIMRGERQRAVLSAIATELRGWPGITRVPAVFRAFRAHVRTNLHNPRRYLQLAWAARTLHRAAVPGTAVNRRGVSYINADWATGREQWRAAGGNGE
jgi:LCP family protein required for cell wall assembly